MLNARYHICHTMLMLSDYSDAYKIYVNNKKSFTLLSEEEKIKESIAIEVMGKLNSVESALKVLSKEIVLSACFYKLLKEDIYVGHTEIYIIALIDDLFFFVTEAQRRFYQDIQKSNKFEIFFLKGKNLESLLNLLLNALNHWKSQLAPNIKNYWRTIRAHEILIQMNRSDTQPVRMENFNYIHHNSLVNHGQFSIQNRTMDGKESDVCYILNDTSQEGTQDFYGVADILGIVFRLSDNKNEWGKLSELLKSIGSQKLKQKEYQGALLKQYFTLICCSDTRLVSCDTTQSRFFYVPWHLFEYGASSLIRLENFWKYMSKCLFEKQRGNQQEKSVFNLDDFFEIYNFFNRIYSFQTEQFKGSEKGKVLQTTVDFINSCLVREALTVTNIQNIELIFICVIKSLFSMRDTYFYNKDYMEITRSVELLIHNGLKNFSIEKKRALNIEGLENIRGIINNANASVKEKFKALVELLFSNSLDSRYLRTKAYQFHEYDKVSGILNRPDDFWEFHFVTLSQNNEHDEDGEINNIYFKGGRIVVTHPTLGPHLILVDQKPSQQKIMVFVHREESETIRSVLRKRLADKNNAAKLSYASLHKILAKNKIYPVDDEQQENNFLILEIFFKEGLFENFHISKSGPHIRNLTPYDIKRFFLAVSDTQFFIINTPKDEQAKLIESQNKKMADFLQQMLPNKKDPLDCKEASFSGDWENYSQALSLPILKKKQCDKFIGNSLQKGSGNIFDESMII